MSTVLAWTIPFIRIWVSMFLEVLEHRNFTDHNPFNLTWRTSDDIIKNDLMFQDPSFVKNQDSVNLFKMALEAYLIKNSDFI